MNKLTTKKIGTIESRFENKKELKSKLNNNLSNLSLQLNKKENKIKGLDDVLIDTKKTYSYSDF